MASSSNDLQKDIYLSALRGRQPQTALSYDDLRLKAMQLLSKRAFDYIDGGAGSEVTLRANRASLDQYRIVPKMLCNVESRTTAIELFGHQIPSPIFTCPIGVLELAHRDADVAVAQACAQVGVPMMISSQASRSMEAITASLKTTPGIFQLYWSKSDALVESFVGRAERSGCSAIVVTLDTTMLGWRPRDLNHGFLPFLYGMGLSQYTSDPVFKSMVADHVDMEIPSPKVNLSLVRALWQMSRRHPGSTLQNFRNRSALKAVKKFIDIYANPALQWSDLERLRKMTSLPILLKGILDPNDAMRAISEGVDGIMVSNHGGRQVDGAVGSLHALNSVIQKVGSQVPVLFDSGIRCGADVFKAIALGAKAVGVGRPYVYALATGGTRGVVDYLRYLQADFEFTMALSGCKNVGEIGREFLRCD